MVRVDGKGGARCGDRVLETSELGQTVRPIGSARDGRHDPKRTVVAGQRGVQAAERLEGVAHVAIDVCVRRIEPDRPFVVSNRFLEPVQRVEDDGAQLPCRHVVRLQLRAACKQNQRLVEASSTVKEMPCLVMRVAMAGIEPDRLLKADQRIGVAPRFYEGIALLPPEHRVGRLIESLDAPLAGGRLQFGAHTLNDAAKSQDSLCRNRRAVGYQGLSSRPSSQR